MIPRWMTRCSITPAWATKAVLVLRSKLLMDNDGIALGHGEGRVDLAMYASVTHHDDVTTLWYPEREFFLLGRRITAEFLADMELIRARG